MEVDFIDYSSFIKHKKLQKFIYLKNLKYTLKKLGLNCNGKKPELLKKLNDFYTNYEIYQSKTKEIVLIQSLIRKFLSAKNGPGFIDKTLCINDEDFYTFETKYEIDALYFYSIKDDNGKIFFFDIRSLEKLITCNRLTNPFTTEPINHSNIEKIKKRINSVKKDKRFKPFATQKMSTEQLFNSRVLSIFQKIDLLDVAAGGTDTKWFTNLCTKKLKYLYKGLEDIWNYRAELSDQKKCAIVPNRNMFSIKVQYVYNLQDNSKNKTFIRKILLDEIEALIDSAIDDENKKTGAYFVLTALTEVSHDCRNSLPWLVQYA